MTTNHADRHGELARRAFRALLEGGAPNGDWHDLDAFGPWGEIYGELAQAHQDGGTDAVRRVWTALANANHGLAALIAGDPGPDTIARTWRSQLITLDDMYAPLPPVEYLAGHMFEVPSLNILFGAPGTLKSFILADLAVCVAAGLPWLPPLPGEAGRSLPVRQSPVLWVDLDNGKRRVQERFAALGRGHGTPRGAPLHVISMPRPWFVAGDSERMGEAAQLVRDLGVRFIVVDNLGTACGGVDENTTAMIDVMSQLRQLSEYTEAAIIVVHHQRKGIGNQGRAEIRFSPNSFGVACWTASMIAPVRRGPFSNANEIASSSAASEVSFATATL